MSEAYVIYKAAGIIIQNRKLLISKSKNKDIYVAPGGKLEVGEAPEEALVRELKEEIQITVAPSEFTFFETFYADAAGLDNVRLRMDCFFVPVWQGEISPSSEIEKILWVNSGMLNSIKIGSIFEHDVIPKLKALDLID